MNGLVHCHAQKHGPLQGKTSPIQEENRLEGIWQYFFESILPSMGSRIPTPLIVNAPQIITLNHRCVRPFGIK